MKKSRNTYSIILEPKI